MKTLIGSAVILVASCGLVRAQAAVEGALTHGMAGTATSAAGKALGTVSNQLAGRLGQQTSNAIRPNVTNVRPGLQKITKVPQTKTAPATASSNGSLIAWIQGGEGQQANTACTDSKDQQKPAACAKAEETHPSEITLPAPK